MFAQAGCQVFVVGRRLDVLEDLTSEVQGIFAVQGDLSVVEDVERVSAEIVRAAGEIDVVVLNAGGSRHGPQSSLQEVADHWLGTMRQNVLSGVLLEHALRPHLRMPDGRVIVISSFAARALAGNAAYGASKAALHRWVMTLADEIGAAGGTANAVAPGFVPETELIAELSPERAQRVTDGIAVRRAGTPDDIADAVRWLSSPESGFVNGTIVEVDGGRRRHD
jgi:3-oxoacyl-[acyl-carrier protein] reductase